MDQHFLVAVAVQVRDHRGHHRRDAPGELETAVRLDDVDLSVTIASGDFDRAVGVDVADRELSVEGEEGLVIRAILGEIIEQHAVGAGGCGRSVLIPSRDDPAARQNL